VPAAKGGFGLLHGCPPLPLFLLPLLPPFSGGGEIGGKIPMGGAIQGGRCRGILYGGALGFASALKRWRFLGVQAHGHAARIRRDGAEWCSTAPVAIAQAWSSRERRKAGKGMRTDARGPPGSGTKRCGCWGSFDWAKWAEKKRGPPALQVGSERRR
jgi:hypothetical protein